MIAMRETICPGCGTTIDRGQSIQPYAKLWYHHACRPERKTFPDGTVGRMTVDQWGNAETVQQRDADIRKTKQLRPYMSVRELAEYMGISKSTVGRALQSAV